MGLKDWTKWTKSIFPPNYDDVEEAYDEEFEEVEEVAAAPVRTPEKVAAPYGRTDNGQVKIASHSSIEMKVVTPTRYDAVTQIADLLLEKKTVLLNLENTNKETAKRLIDFLSGVAYALNGDVQKVADNTFAVTPNNVAVSNESVDGVVAETADGELYE